MLEVAIMIEGQNGLNWAHWQTIARLVEELGFVGLYRSDHFTKMCIRDRPKTVMLDADHFVHQEKPDEVNKIILEWLR